MTKHDERPLATQTAAPPPAPPRRPLVAAMADDDADRLENLQRALQAAQEQTRAVLAYLRERLKGEGT